MWTWKLAAQCRLLRSPSRARLDSNLQRVAPHARNLASSSGGFRCQSCGQNFVKWQGQCSACSEWGSVVSSKPSEPLFRQSNASSFTKNKTKRAVAWSSTSLDTFEESVPHALRMNEVELDTFVERIELPERELNWVLGGGLVAGSLTLVAGNPGVGKSTLALQMANMLANGSAMRERGVLYVSGEESVLQVRMRAERLGSVSDSLFVASETNLNSVFRLLEGGNGRELGDDEYQGFGAVVVDSIQTVYAEDIPSPAGTVNQVKECTLRLLRLAKSRNVPVILIGHVTKSGDIAGPKVLEHIVDTVVQLEGDPQSARRFLRCQKNRFGNTSEVGVFNMMDEGLQPLPNPLMAFVSSHDEDDDDYPDNGEETEVEPLDGCSVTIAMEGKRPIPLEIQALANRTQYNVDAGRGGGQSFSRVRGVGVAFDKLLLLFAVLEKRARVSCRNQSVFVNIAEGYTIQEPAADLALAVALASSVLGRPVLERAAFLGEVSLSGHVRPVKMLESRLTAAQKIGLEVCVIPKEHDQATRRALRKKFANTLTVIEVSTLLQALKIAFRSPTTASFLSRPDGASVAEDGSTL
ncbi:DNA repair protein RadA [Phytophthora nicotianae CJ01A1]|uniref:DNA repair protein RadA n=10 Tax=Phytophthora nicotianae TaxID=4792 RepID=W2PYF0_PHYN3|nr:DNA repair protein RadA [Phytophthora nicotianae INRA-310]ETK81975.1 DNA repair protein RadA [Phytophthora nicotianae]ETO70567.1 DNA repair protein RadA [Phytophthora nicotianae P1976]ETP11691.1 DNA repair protein RadA [Phytophthora nicotianae CJ01A1]ETP39805.1 DNA repair protein RadA [Phytophthora nicotianae P10297]ETL35381.1 DNA repair protein RadA [Phytophthora nicotianae]